MADLDDGNFFDGTLSIYIKYIFIIILLDIDEGKAYDPHIQRFQAY